MSSSSGLQIKELKQQSSAKCYNEEDVVGIPEQMELALHATPGASMAAVANELPLSCSQVPIAPAATVESPVGVEYIEQLPDTTWDRVIRTLVRCLMYCIDRIAAGFGLSRQQTTWYKHCWDNPTPHPRGISFLGASDKFIAPLSLMDELAEENETWLYIILLFHSNKKKY